MKTIIESKDKYVMWKHWLRGDYMLKPTIHSVEMINRGYKIVENPSQEEFEGLQVMFAGHEIKLIEKP